MSEQQRRIGLIWAQARGGVIGQAGGIPWHVPEDARHFKDLTAGFPVVMGRRTWDSLEDRYRPLPGRRNIVVTRDPGWRAEGAERAGSLDEALAIAEGLTGPGADPGWTWVMGGGQLYVEAIGRAHRLEVTELDLEVDGDTLAPPFDGWRVAEAEPAEGWALSRTGVPYRFLSLLRP